MKSLDAMHDLNWYFSDINVSAVGVHMASKSYFASLYYPGGSDLNYYGFNYNKIVKIGTGVGYPQTIVISGIGQLGITGFAVDWIAGALGRNE